jgi:hypothetical protein
MSKRTYNFDLPFKPSWLQRVGLKAILHDPKYADDIKRLNSGLRAKLENCTSDTEFTASDFDSLPDPIWAKLASHLG